MSHHEDVPASRSASSPSAIQLRAFETVAESPPAPTSGELPENLAGRYQLHGRIGKGGMGEVFSGRDPALGRDLALKVLLADSSEQPQAVERFREEAQIGGQLQHPGVVPVYELGNLGDGRPYFTMKLVKGQTLAHLLKERRDPGHERPRFLKVFEQICQTVAYAHARGVIHRDLKPGNVMVGAFGEVLVMDWGLAKVLASEGRESPEPAKTSAEQTRTVVKVSRTDLVPDTREGDVLGTPAYMPPEQALGEIDRLDERCDVFSLGAILCEILTGQKVYIGDNGQEVLRKARRAELEDALSRLAGCAADAELIALAKRCLTFRRDDRPRHAGEVASAIEGYLAGVEERARKAELERAAAQACEEEAKVTAAAERRARRMTLGMAAAVLLLVVGGGSGAWLLQQQRAEANQHTAVALQGAHKLLEQGWQATDLAQLAMAEVEADRAVKVSRSGSSQALRDEADALLQEVKAKREQAKLNSALLTALLDVVQPSETRSYRTTETGPAMAIAEIPAEEQYTAAFRRWGADVDAMSLEELVRRLGEQPLSVRDEVVAGLDEWLRDRKLGRQPEARRQRLRDLADGLDKDASRKELRQLRESGTLKHHGEWLRTFVKQVKPSSARVLSVVALVSTLREARETQLAEGILRAVLAERPSEVVLLNLLGNLLEEHQPPRWAEAAECYRASRALRPQLGVALARALVELKRAVEAESILTTLTSAQPDNPELHFYTGLARQEQQKLKEAEAAYRKAIALKPDSAAAHNNLGHALGAQKKMEEAEVACRKAIDLQPDDALAYSNLGNALAAQKKMEEAEAAYRKAIDLRPEYAVAHYNLGLALVERKKLTDGVAAYRKAIALKPDFARAYYNLGFALEKQKKLTEAEATFRKAIALEPDFAAGHDHLGTALAAQKKMEEAEAAYRKAIDLRPEYAVAHYNLGLALVERMKLTDGVAAYRKAIALKPDFADAYNALGIALQKQQKQEEAAAAYRKAIELQPDFARAYSNLGTALAAQGKMEEAVVAHRKAIELQPDLARAYYNLGNALVEQKKLTEAEATFRKAIELVPDFAQAYHNLGSALAKQRKLTEAEVAFRKAIVLQPDDAPAYYNLGNALAMQKRMEEAVAAFRKATEIKPDFAQAYRNLGNALRDQQKLEEAVAAFRKADQLLPNHPVIRNNLRTTERWLELDRQLPTILAGKAKPRDAVETLEFASFCLSYKQFSRAACTFYRDAFALDPKLAADLNRQHRYNAACTAALASAGKGEDAAKLEAKERDVLRKQALDWLQADLTAYAKLMEKPTSDQKQAVRQLLSHWREDPDLSAIRDDKALAALPEAERKLWQQLWADVANLLKKTEPATDPR